MKFNKNFILSVVASSVIWYFWALTGLQKPWHIVVILLCSYPWEMPSGRVFSLWGGFSNRDIYSLFGIFQIAQLEAKSLLGVNLYQRASYVWQGFGINLFQIAGYRASHKMGFVFYQSGRLIGSNWMSIHFVRHFIREPAVSKTMF